MSGEDFDCQKCGACCHGPQGWVDVDEAMDDTPCKLCQDFYGWTKGYRTGVMKMVEGRCIALHGEPGAFACSIYKKRPASCREFEPGCDACLEARNTMYGDNPP